MSRRRRRQDEPIVSVADATTPLSLTRALLSPPSPAARPTVDRLIDDRREYHPLGFFKPATKISTGGPVGPLRVSRPTKARPGRLPVNVGFTAPGDTAICVRRKQRKEVLHALKRTGKGGARRRPKFNWFSRVSC